MSNLGLVDLDKILIEASAIPSRKLNVHGRLLEQYEVRAYLEGVYVAAINIERALNTTGKDSDRVFLDFRSSPPVPNPIVSYQKTEESFRGEGIIGRVIFLANEFYREFFGKPLYSTTYSTPSARRAAPQRVWKKLESKGLAKYDPCVIKDKIGTKFLERWAMV